MRASSDHYPKDLVEHMLRETALEAEAQTSTWQVLGRANVGATSYGGFVGYNIGWRA